MSRRKLRQDELELWRKVAKTTDRLHPEKTRPKTRFEESEKLAPKRINDTIEKFELGQKAGGKPGSHDVLPGLPDRIASAPIRMDRKAYGRLKRGKLKPEGRIDLHGMTLNQAKPALASFIAASYARDRRLVLVITGKGKRSEDDGPIPTRPGVLRHNVPHWLQTPPLSQMVLQVSEAHARHGGGGAYYVYLRRKR